MLTTHGAMTLLRGFADDIPLKKWLNDHIWPAESRWMSESFVQTGTDLAMAEMIKGGTTTFNEMYFFPDVVSRSVIRVGMRACVGLTVIEFPTAWAQNANEYIEKGLVVRDQIKGSDLLSVALAPHAPYTVSDDTLSRLVSLAEELDCQIHMHIHETLDELEESQSNYGLRPLERLRRLSALSSRMIAVHMTHLLPEEVQVLAELGVHVIHCPESNLKLASGICLINELHCAGINVALGTDGAASNNDLDMLGEGRTASLLAKGVSRDPTAMNARQTLRMATINGAKALGQEKFIGSIEVGKWADLAAINLSAYGTQPVYDPVAQLIYSASRDQFTDVWVQGRRVLREKKLTTIDEEKVMFDVAQWHKKLSV